MTFAPERTCLFTLEDKENPRLASSVYQEPNGEISMWIKVGISVMKIDDIPQAIDLIDLIEATLDKIGELDGINL